MSNKLIYFSGLNGLRAIAAMAVMIAHITLSLEKFNLSPHILGTFNDGNPRGLDLGGYGVSIFFVLSGFLITFLLQTEKDISPIDIKKFYWRRILRIWPLYYSYLAVVIIVLLIFGIGQNFNSLPFYIFYSANIPFILSKEIPLVGHYWSLGVEEQFYSFWPWINKKCNSISRITFGLILTLISIKTLLHLFYPNSMWELAIHVTRFHCMMIGALGAILYKQKNILFLKIIDNKICQGICWFIMFLVTINKYDLISFLDNEILSVITLCIIIGQINIKNRLVNLETNYFDFLGKISYGIYVIHPLLIFLLSKALTVQFDYLPLKYFVVYFLVIVSTILLAYFSFTYFESYFLIFKKRFNVIESSGTKNFK